MLCWLPALARSCQGRGRSVGCGEKTPARLDLTKSRSLVAFLHAANIHQGLTVPGAALGAEGTEGMRHATQLCSREARGLSRLPHWASVFSPVNGITASPRRRSQRSEGDYVDLSPHHGSTGQGRPSARTCGGLSEGCLRKEPLTNSGRGPLPPGQITLPCFLHHVPQVPETPNLSFSRGRLRCLPSSPVSLLLSPAVASGSHGPSKPPALTSCLRGCLWGPRPRQPRRRCSVNWCSMNCERLSTCQRLSPRKGPQAPTFDSTWNHS